MDPLNACVREVRLRAEVSASSLDPERGSTAEAAAAAAAHQLGPDHPTRAPSGIRRRTSGITGDRNPPRGARQPPGVQRFERTAPLVACVDLAQEEGVFSPANLSLSLAHTQQHQRRVMLFSLHLLESLLKRLRRDDSRSIDDTLDRPIRALISLRIQFHPALLPLSSNYIFDNV
ncbi:unnamed protein product [Pleuronectes platessa]|uniref:Uncharacterized protein n=1 Tax=Pleuronectes platessa TaxID=8262 RepID=A0A9N7YML2_PLEPL|nr:unnamed protein product [Pleuronectes platessa]